jgi:hypothetical protein
MCFVGYRAAKAIVDSRLAEVQGWHESDILLRELEVKRVGALSRRGQEVLYRLGRQLVAWGKQLERYGLPQPSH